MPTNAITTCLRELQKLLGVEKIKITYDYDGRNFPQKPNEWLYNEVVLEQGNPTPFTLVNEEAGLIIARWNLQEMPSCCGIAIMSEFFVNPRSRKTGVGKEISKLIRLIAKKMNYRILLGTDVITNTYHQQSLKRDKFKSLLKFRNRNTGNRINISASVL